MGNSPMDAARIGVVAQLVHFHSANTWIEGAALEQARQVLSLPGMKSVCTFPDLHPGKYGPVGSAMLADRLYPQLIGNDIGCGMSLFRLDANTRKLRLDKAAEQLRALEGPTEFDVRPSLDDAGLNTDLFAGQLGTIGGGNHFCELQAMSDLIEARPGLVRDCAYLLVHSGSRALGTSIFAATGFHPEGIASGTMVEKAYLQAHDEAVRWASLNRQIIAERAARALRAQCELVADSPHNLVERHNGQYLHRKGAAKADLPLVPLAGSRDALSFILVPGDNVGTALDTLAHGSGRKFDRRSMHGRVGTSKAERERLARNANGGFIVCDDRQLLIEEAPAAYKKPEQVVADLEAFGLARVVASFKPLVTFKNAAERGELTVLRRKGGRGHGI